MVFDPSEPSVAQENFKHRYWYSIINVEIEEELPPNMTDPRVLGLGMRVYMDRDHAGDSVYQQYRTGLVVFLNEAPIYYMSKKKNSCETSTFGS